MNIQGKKVLLRAVESRDLQALNEWSNDPSIWYMLGGWHFPFSMQDTNRWFESISINDQKNQIFAIELDDVGIVGTANLVNIDWKNKNAFHGVMIGRPEYHGQGVALDAVFSLMKYAFNELGLNRLDTDIIAYNERSLNFYIDKCGWVVEGGRKSWYYRNGSYHDKVILGITHERFQEYFNEIN